MDEAQTVNLSSGTGPEDTNTEQSGEKQMRESEKISESGEKQMGESEKISESGEKRMGESEKISESGEKQMGESEKISEAVLPPEPSAAPLDSVEGTVLPSPMELCPEESKLGANAAAEEPPVDWFEPLEDDDDPQALDRASFDHHYSRKDPEEESLAGESEKSFASVKKRKPFMNNQSNRGKKIPDEGWDDCPALGEGWKRREVIRRSGSSIGHKDVYYLSPHGERLRSRVELMTLLEGRMDLSSFEFKSGRFRDAGEVPPKRVRRKREVQDHSSSESSWRGEGADTPDSLHRLNPGAKLTPYNQMSPYPLGHARVFKDEDDVKDDRIKLPNTFSSKPPSSTVNGLALINPEDTVLICYNCGIRFVGTYYDKQRKKPWCPSCWEASKAREHPLIRFRKWIPCGQCVACRNTTNCGQCANCKHGMESPEARKRLCRKRKCICPIRKGSGMETETQQSPFDLPDTFNNMNYQNEIVAPPQRSSYQSYPNSDTEDFNPFDDFDDDDDSTDDDDNWHKKRKRRACGTCNACVCKKDCGTCDFCIDKPKFGGSNKKRQKCRLRQCQRQAMRHLLPGFSQHEERLMMMGRPKPQYTYSRKTNPKKNKGRIGGLVWTDNEDEDSNQPTMSWSYENTSNSKYSELNYIDHQSSVQVNHLDSRQRNGLPNSVSKISNNGIGQSDQLSRWEADRSNSDRVAENHSVELEGPMVPQITQIYSMADGDTAAGSGSNMDDQLLELLQALRNSALPLLWYVVLAEGPQLQLVQCSKQSSMSDTMVLIDPGFCYQVVVQKQPLLLTHPLYDDHPSHMNTPTEVATLLLDLEKYRVCQGLPLSDQLPPKGLIIFERASTCDFLVKKDVESCVNCQAL